ncbi:hypothetical protein ACJMK2_017496 [Sinanodonta woodiana]|uniref:EGF-like domain-containing protein n=1 Tax=Sinanodonta woodiana TaxID=1069815 RepID=A0ABD3UAN5_SINWO
MAAIWIVEVYLTVFIVTSIQAIRHGQNLIWTQTPLLKLGVSRIVGIEGDPSQWVPSGDVQVRHISAPHIGWQFCGLSYHYSYNTLYWSEKSSKKIQGLLLNGTTETVTLYSGTSKLAEGIAVDWISNNLYWTDSLYDWIVMTPLSSDDANENVYKLVVRTTLTNPHSVAVYPQKGYLFWTDWGTISKIEASDLLGKNRRVVVDEGLGHPRGLAIDFVENTLYWVDSLKDTIESVEINGNGRRVVAHQDGTTFFGLALYGKYIFVTEQMKGHLRVYERATGNNVINYQLGYIPDGIVMYDEQMQPGNSSVCDMKKCDQFCVNDPIAGAECYCGEGYEMNQNNTCILSRRIRQPSHIYAIGAAICHYPVNLPDMSLKNVTLESQCFMESAKGYMALTYDAYEHILYFTENVTKTIGRVSLAFGESTQSIIRGIGVVEGLALDWITGNLFWTDSQYRHIAIATKAGLHQTVVIEDDLDIPRGIAVYPSRGKMYWTDAGETPKVEEASMDGSNRRVIANSSIVGSPNHLYIDFKTNILYWSDSGLFHITSYNIQSGDMKIIFSQPDIKFYGVTIYQDYVFWTDSGDMNGIHAARIDSEEKVRGILHPHVGLAQDVITFDLQNQPPDASSCGKDNGGCEQLCVPTSNETYICICGVGYILDENLRTCSSQINQDNFILVSDSYRRQLYQIDAVDNTVHAVPLQKNYRAIALDFDPLHGKILWTDNMENVIMTAWIDGTGEAIFRKLPPDSIVDGIAVDYISRLLYYTCTGYNTIVVASLDLPQMYRTIIDSDLDEPRDIITDPFNGVIYWTDWGDQPKIESASMDGSNRTILVYLPNKTWPNALALDFKTQNLFWVDAKNNTIEVLNLATGMRKIILQEENAHYFGLHLMSGYLYITDWTRKFVLKMPMNGGELIQVGPPQFSRLNGVYAYNASELPQGTNICNSHSCSHMCVPVSKISYRCLCPDLNSTLEIGSQCAKDSDVIFNESREQIAYKIIKNQTDSKTGFIVGIVVLVLTTVAVLVVGIIYVYRRYHSTTFRHGKLVQESRVDSFYRLTFPDTTKDDTNFDSGIENPSFDFAIDSGTNYGPISGLASHH